MPKPTIAECRALAATLDDQHPDAAPEQAVATLAKAVEVDDFTREMVTRELARRRRLAPEAVARMDVAAQAQVARLSATRELHTARLAEAVAMRAAPAREASPIRP